VNVPWLSCSVLIRTLHGRQDWNGFSLFVLALFPISLAKWPGQAPSQLGAGNSERIYFEKPMRYIIAFIAKANWCA
jgi:hypothetical protein